MSRRPRSTRSRPAQFRANARPGITRVAILRDARGIFDVVTDTPEIVAVSICTVEDRETAQAEDGTLHSLAVLDTVPTNVEATRDADFFGVDAAPLTASVVRRAEAVRSLLTVHAMRMDDISTAMCSAALKDIASDFLADFLHFCDAAGFDFAALEARARLHYLAELQDARDAAARDAGGAR